MRIANVRILCQVSLFVLFVAALVLMTAPELAGYAVSIFLEADPLVALTTVLSTGHLYHVGATGLFFGVGILVGGKCTVLGNRVKGGAKGIEASAAGSEFFRNLVLKTVGVGIDVIGTGMTLERNTVRKAGTVGVQLDASGGNTLNRNRAAGSGNFDLVDAAGDGNTFDDRNRFRNVGP